MTTRKELVEALRLRYRSAAFSDRIKILDEFVALTCYHRKHAIRVLRGEFSPATEVRLRNRVYDEAVAQALTVLWEAADRVCGKRLKPLIPMLVDAMERHGHLDLDPVIKTKILQVSAATIDRVLAASRSVGCATVPATAPVVDDNYLGRRIDSSELLPVLTCCLT